jgi:serine/threonine protein phosphatase 1
MGDLHGAQKAFVQVMERASFDPAEDRLIFMGDVVDGWPESRECIDALLALPDAVWLMGNHDEWFAEWVDGRDAEPAWVQQGGRVTLAGYNFNRLYVPDAHRDYLKRAKLWHEEGDRMFVHGGWPRSDFSHPMGCPDLLTWDRTLWNEALNLHGHKPRLTQFSEVYIGHTTTTRAGFTEPVQRCEVWNMDQGAGWEGKLSLMDVDTKEVWQSDAVATLYPEASSRRRAG